MNEKLQLEIQAYLDGELSPAASRRVTELLGSDAEAIRLSEELQQVKAVLVENEPQARLPESREFYWSKIEREIRRLETAPAPRRMALPFWNWRRWFAPAAALALVVGLGVTFTKQLHSTGDYPSQVESFLEGMGSFTFRDHSAGMTVVWIYEEDQPKGGDQIILEDLGIEAIFDEPQ